MDNTQRKEGLSNYFDGCAGGGDRPKYEKPDVSQIKQGKVVRLETDVRKVQAWAGMDADRKNDGRMTVSTSQAIQQKIADYQRDNNIAVDGKNPAGYINKATLEAMKNDPNIPEGVVESLEKTRKYMVYSKEITAEAICEVPVMPAAEVTNAAQAPYNYKDLNLSNADLPPEKLAANQAQALKEVLQQYQKNNNIPETGRFDQTTLTKIESDPAAAKMKPQYDVWKQAGLITEDGQWDQAQERSLRTAEWAKSSSTIQASFSQPLSRPQDSFNIQSQFQLTEEFKEASLSMIPLDKQNPAIGRGAEYGMQEIFTDQKPYLMMKGP